MSKRFFHAMDIYNEIFHSLSIPDLALKKTLELNVAELWADIDPDLIIEDRVLACCCKSFLICCSVLDYLQGKEFQTRNTFADGGLGYVGNSSSLYLITRACCFPPAVFPVVPDMQRVITTDTCWQVSVFLSKNAQGKISCERFSFPFR